jgi:hypothetical protein
MRSLPGDRLYGLKGLSEDARLLFAAGSTEARVRVDLADERFSEVERLIERQALLAAGQGTHAVAVPEHIDDPILAGLIESALQEAGKHLQTAADILTTQPVAHAGDLDELVSVSRRGHELATEVAEDLPIGDQPPVLSTVVKLAKIEAAAKAARTKAHSTPTPPPCATPNPKPAATPEPTATPEATQTPADDPSPTPTPQATVSPTPTPAASPVPTPCTTPSPTPTPTPTAEPTAEPPTEPQPTPGVEDGVDGGQDGDGSGDDEANGESEGGQDSAAADPATA